MLRLIIDCNVVTSAFRSRSGASFALIEPVETHLSWRPQLSDPDDEMVLEAAINGHADALVTYNGAHFRTAAARFDVRLARPVGILCEVIKS